MRPLWFQQFIRLDIDRHAERQSDVYADRREETVNWLDRWSGSFDISIAAVSNGVFNLATPIKQATVDRFNLSGYSERWSWSRWR